MSFGPLCNRTKDISLLLQGEITPSVLVIKHKFSSKAVRLVRLESTNKRKIILAVDSGTCTSEEFDRIQKVLNQAGFEFEIHTDPQDDSNRLVIDTQLDVLQTATAFDCIMMDGFRLPYNAKTKAKMHFPIKSEEGLITTLFDDKQIVPLFPGKSAT
jgi:hypothetical protein